MLDHLIRTQGLPLVITVVLGFAIFYVMRVAYAMREGVGWWLRASVVAGVVFIMARAFLPTFRFSPGDTQVFSFAAAVAAIAFTPKRSRYIPADIKRKVVTRDLKGKKYDSKKHHIDHIWPHSRGGSNTGDNLRVIGKKENLRKGARKPGLTDWL